MAKKQATTGYLKWMEYHCRLISVKSDVYNAMLREWFEKFDAIRATPLQLEQASDWLAVNWLPVNPTGAWGAHPGAMYNWILAQNRIAKAKEQVAELRKETATFASDGKRASVKDAMRGIGKPGEAKDAGG